MWLQVNETVLESVTHEDAVSALKATQTNVVLTVVKLVYPSVTPQGTPRKVGALFHYCVRPHTLPTP